jgi:hypothetical protein
MYRLPIRAYIGGTTPSLLTTTLDAAISPDSFGVAPKGEYRKER